MSMCLFLILKLFSIVQSQLREHTVASPPLYLTPAKRKLATKSNSKKCFSVASVCLHYVNEQESGGHQLKIMDAKFMELNYCMFSILLV